jgi:hypothetical protein
MKRLCMWRVSTSARKLHDTSSKPELYVDAKDSKGSTSLQYVLKSNSIGSSGYVLCDNDLEIVSALLEFGATPHPESMQTFASHVSWSEALCYARWSYLDGCEFGELWKYIESLC